MCLVLNGGNSTILKYKTKRKYWLMVTLGPSPEKQRTKKCKNVNSREASTN